MDTDRATTKEADLQAVTIGPVRRLDGPVNLVEADPAWPGLYEHRLCKGPDTNMNLHILSVGTPEVDRMLLFRDRLRSDPDEFALYLATKRELAGRHWEFAQQYADAKSDVIEAILGRAAIAADDEAR